MPQRSMRLPSSALSGLHDAGRYLVILTLLLVTTQERTLAADPPSKKLIEWGWDEPDTQFIRQNIERMEKKPFDGFVFHAMSKQGDNLAWLAWGPRGFKQADFQQAIDDLKATPFRLFTDRFLRVNVCPGNVDWFDDRAWAVVQQNFTLAAQIARQGGCRGFMFDVEQYEGRLFEYRKQAHQATKLFSEYQAKVRQRGREWMRAVGGEFPEITVLLTFGYSITQPRDGAKDRSEVPYGLLADFLDGMLEVSPATAKIVDAWEGAYPYKREEQFREAYDTIKKKTAAWSAVPDKYRAQVQAGFGIWMDYDWRKNGWSLTDFSKNHFSPAQFESAVRSALVVSDGYVWIYTEQPRWWTDERLPQDYVEALTRARAIPTPMNRETEK
ncbi:MAG: hypothetical protein K8T91_23520 [Planctomycetes bacterium]|nr:hypothetical protein [Planctomycetota bacterium]